MDSRVKVAAPINFSKTEKQSFLSLLIEQGKVQSPSIDKIDRCHLLGMCFSGTSLVSIGAIKPKTASDFSSQKADLIKLETKFDWELGYFFTNEKFRGKGLSSKVAKELIKNCETINLMASTETKEGNPMINILETNGFKQQGKRWKSVIHGGELGLFLKMHII